MGRGVFPGGNSWKAPLFKLGRFPIHVTGLIILLQVVGMLLVVVFGTGLGRWVHFSADGVLAGRVWTVVTYAFFEGPSIWFVIGAYFFFMFGSAVERSISRKDYVTMCVALLLIPPAVFLLFHFLNFRMAPGTFLPLGNVPHLGVFFAFCAMHPNAQSFFGIRIKWFGLAFLAMAVLQWVALRVWPMTLSYLVAAGFVVWYVGRLGFREGFSLGEELLGPGRRYSGPKLPQKKKKKVRRAREIKPKLRPKSASVKADDSEVDRILDKINQEGLHSLTKEERELLQRKAGK